MKHFSLLFSLLFSLQLFAFEASIEKINGECYVDGKAVKTGAAISQGQKIKTKGKGSYAIIKYSNGTKFTLKEGSIQIKKLSEKNSLIGLFKGTFLSYVNKLSKDEKSKKKDNKKKQNFRVLTPHASMGVRGTKFWVKVDKKESYLCVCEGEVEVKRKKEKKSVKRSQDIIVSKTNKMKVSSANDDMWNMAVDGLKLMDVSVKPR